MTELPQIEQFIAFRRTLRSRGIVAAMALLNDRTSFRVECRHRPEQLANDTDADLFRTPMLALDKRCLAASASDEINAAVGTTSATFLDPVATPTENFADKELELLPRHRLDRRGPGRARCLGN